LSAVIADPLVLFHIGPGSGDDSEPKRKGGSSEDVPILKKIEYSDIINSL